MNFVEFAYKYFSGNADKAIECLAHESYTKEFKFSGSRKNLRDILDTMDKNTAEKYVDYLEKEIIKNPQIFEGYVENAEKWSALNLSYEEVRDAKVNPYKAKVAKGFLKGLIGGTGLLALSTLIPGASDPGIINSVCSGMVTLFGSYCAMDVGVNLINYFKFKKIKKEIEANEKSMNDNGGKTLWILK